jgi:hypothetical protein
MVGKSRLDRRGSGPFWFILLAIVIYCLFSLTVALTTAQDCEPLGKQWQIFPPEWECTRNPNYG